MRNIADQAGIEAASIYYHFPSKEELVEAVMEQGAAHIVHHLNEHLDALSPDATAEQRFRAAVLGQMRGLVIHGDFAVAHGRLLGQLPDAIRERQVARREHHQTLWNGLLEDLRAEGSLRERGHPARANPHPRQHQFDPVVVQPAKGSLERIADQLCTMFLCGVGPSSRP